MRTRRLRAGAAVVLLMAGPLAAEDPMSAIDWLERFPPAQVALPVAPGLAGGDEPPVSRTALSPDVTVTALDAPVADAVGLLPTHVTGFPVTLWRGSDPGHIADLIFNVPVSRLPAMQALLFTLLLAEADAPGGATENHALLEARVARLLALGAVEAAEALLERAGHTTPRLFALWFDTALLTGRADTACADLLAAPHLAPGYAARIYCLALSGDWDTAATTLETAGFLGAVTATEAALLWRFLDPELAEEAAALAPPARFSPLKYRLYEGLGEAPPSAVLDRAFATIALSGDSGWKAQLEAAERLARAGAIPDNRLLGIYTDRLPAASGGIWDRVEALQRFETALRAGDPAGIGKALLRAWPQMRAAGLAVPFAQLFGERLIGLPLAQPARDMAAEVMLLSPAYERAAATIGPQAPARLRFLAGVAQGAPRLDDATGAPGRAVANGFAAPAPDRVASDLVGHRLGELVLDAMGWLDRGLSGNGARLSDALATFRAVGLEDSARRAALQLLILEPR